MQTKEQKFQEALKLAETDCFDRFGVKPAFGTVKYEKDEQREFDWASTECDYFQVSLKDAGIMKEFMDYIELSVRVIWCDSYSFTSERTQRIVDIEQRCKITYRVAYTHHSGGSNGQSRTIEFQQEWDGDWKRKHR